MGQSFFQFRQFTVQQGNSAMKVCTDSCILGAFAADKIRREMLDPGRVLDIGGGTGLLSLMIAQQVTAQIDAVEIDPDAAGQMQENFSSSPWAGRLKVVHGDIRTTPLTAYDFIISNPPFYENELKGDQKKKTLAMHDSGLLLSELATAMSNLLSYQGHFCVMVPWFRESYMMDQLSGRGLHIMEILSVKHSAAHQPFRSIIFGRKSDAPHPIKRKELIIREGMDYTAPFRRLLKEYYLNL